ncbi:MAG: hypothetical protein JSW52_07615 [Candidatus Coatesbacteria bacterium]|nr:MAG: hypothetical protein JSW52_07615 [Candidatus Coatesbacteria bacterium]
MMALRLLLFAAVAAAFMFAPYAPADENVVDFPEAVTNLEDVPDEVDSGILVVISGGFSPFAEKRWLAWTDDGDVYRLDATLAPAGEVEARIRSADPASYDAFETELLELGILDLTNPETTGTGASYVTDLPTYDVYFKTDADYNAFSVRNPAAAGETYSRIIEAILGYFEGE